MHNIFCLEHAKQSQCLIRIQLPLQATKKDLENKVRVVDQWSRSRNRKIDINEKIWYVERLEMRPLRHMHVLYNSLAVVYRLFP